MDSPWFILGRALGSLGLVLALIFALAWLAKKFVKPQSWLSPLASIKIHQNISIAPKKKLMIVEVEGRRLLLGLGAEAITMLCELNANVVGIQDPRELSQESSHVEN